MPDHPAPQAPPDLPHATAVPAITDLRYRIRAVVPGMNQSKVVHVDWFVRREGTDGNEVDITLLNDAVAVPPRAGNEEILRIIEARRGEVAETTSFAVPNPETNQALVGHEG